MFGSNVLDIGIGLVFTYLCLSLACTAISEAVSAAFRSRARDLERGIRNLLDGKSSVPERWWWPVIRKLTRRAVAAPPQAGAWSDAFFNHQLINALSQDAQRPSYVPSQTFAAVLGHLLARSATEGSTGPTSPADPLNGSLTFDEIHAAVSRIQGNDRLREALLPLVEEARTDLTTGVAAMKKFNDQVEIWFDHTMDRVSGWYKRRTQLVLLAIAVAGAFALNVDTIVIARSLAKDRTLRESIVGMAQQAVERGDPTAGPVDAAGKPTTRPATELPAAIRDVQQSIADLDQLGIPIGWVARDDAHPGAAADPQRADNLREVFRSPERVLSKFLGLLLTALAASFGAPFWFDVLNKFMTVRSAGKAPEEKPKNPKAVLQPQSPADTPARQG